MNSAAALAAQLAQNLVEKARGRERKGEPIKHSPQTASQALQTQNRSKHQGHYSRFVPADRTCDRTGCRGTYGSFGRAACT